MILEVSCVSRQFLCSNKPDLTHYLKSPSSSVLRWSERPDVIGETERRNRSSEEAPALISNIIELEIGPHWKENVPAFFIPSLFSSSSLFPLFASVLISRSAADESHGPDESRLMNIYERGSCLHSSLWRCSFWDVTRPSPSPPHHSLLLSSTWHRTWKHIFTIYTQTSFLSHPENETHPVNQVYKSWKFTQFTFLFHHVS